MSRSLLETKLLPFASALPDWIDHLYVRLQKIASEQDQYYVLTFTPPESKEGTCHTLRLKVDRAGTTVRARNSYCTAKALDLLAGMGRMAPHVHVIALLEGDDPDLIRTEHQQG